MNPTKPIIFSETTKIKKLFRTTEYTYYGLRSPDGKRVILPAEYDKIIDAGSGYFAARRGGWRCFDSDGLQLVLYRFREGMEGSWVSPSTTLACCTSFLEEPRFIDGFAAVNTNFSCIRGEWLSSWHIINTVGRVLLSIDCKKLCSIGGGFFATVKDDMLSVFDVRGRLALRVLSPLSAAKPAGEDPYPLRLEDGFFTLGDYRIEDGDTAEAFIGYIGKLRSACGLPVCRTTDFSDGGGSVHAPRSFTLSFAPSAQDAPSLYLDVKISGALVRFRFRVPAFPGAAMPVPHQPDMRLLLDEDAILHHSLYGNCQFNPADAKAKDLPGYHKSTYSESDYDWPRELL